MLINNLFIEKQIDFKPQQTALAKYIDGIISGDTGLWTPELRGYWTGEVSAYLSPEWEDHNGDGENKDVVGSGGNAVDFDLNRPFVFSAGEYFRLSSATFRAFGNNTLSGTYNISSNKYGLSVNNGTVPAADNGGNYVLPVGTETGALLTKIDADTETIEWEIAGENIRTKHPVYVIGGSMNAQNNFHTLLHIGCNAAKGLSPNDPDAIVWSVWNFVNELQICRIDGEGPLKYWGSDTVDDNEVGHNDISGLLATKDGNCVAWGQFFKELLSLQGVSCSLTLLHMFDRPDPKNSKECLGFLQKKNTVQGGSIDLAASHVTFGDHVLLEYFDSHGTRRIFDIGTGRGPFSTWQEYAVSELEFCYGTVERTPDGHWQKNISFCENVTNPENYFVYSN